MDEDKGEQEPWLFLEDSEGEEESGERSRTPLETNTRKRYFCDICNKEFTRNYDVKRHKERGSCNYRGNQHLCDICGSTFRRPWELKRHHDRWHNKYNIQAYRCHLCGANFETPKQLEDHFSNQHRVSGNFELVQDSLDSAYRRYACVINTVSTPDIILEEPHKSNILSLINDSIKVKPVTRVGIMLYCLFEKDSFNEEPRREKIPLKTTSHVVSQYSDMEKEITEFSMELHSRLDAFVSSGSGWRLVKIESIGVDFLRIAAFRFGNGTKLPSDIVPQKLQKHLLDPIANNEMCVLYCIAAGLFSNQMINPSDSSDPIYQGFINSLDLNDIEFPMSYYHIEQLLAQNDLGITLHMFQLYEKDVYHMKSIGKGDTVICLLGINTVDSDMAHFMLIKNFDHFVKGRVKREDGTTHTNYNRKWYCMKCLSGFGSLSILNSHKEICSVSKPQVEQYPDVDATKGKRVPWVSFKNKQNQYKLPLIGVYDFECILSPYENVNRCGCARLSCQCLESTSIAENLHLPVCYAYAFVNSENRLIKEKATTLSRPEAAVVFLEELLQMQDEILAHVEVNNPMIPLTQEQKEEYENATVCNHCREPLNGSMKVTGFDGDYNVQDHDHYTGKFLGAAHRNCNLTRPRKFKIPMFAHNANSYDLHLILQAVATLKKTKPELMKKTQLKIIPKNTQKLRSLVVGIYEFKDSFQFLGHSLSRLVENLHQKGCNFDILKQSKVSKHDDCVDCAKKNSECFDPEKYELNKLGKGIFPYEMLDSVDTLWGTKEYPPHKNFFSKLNNSNVSYSDWLHGLKSWNLYKCNDMVDYTTFYCLLDVLLLCEVLMSFRTDYYEFSKLDCCRYLGLPGLAYDAFLLTTGSKIGLITDRDQFNFVESSIRGGYAGVCLRYAQATLPNEHILYIDENNQYGNAQSKFLPVGKYRWAKNIEALEEAIKNGAYEHWTGEESTGMILEVDLSYPAELHSLHSDMPLAPYRALITYDDLSPESKRRLDCIRVETKETAKRHGISYKYKQKKLISTLLPRYHYITNYLNLQLYLRLGMKLERVHKALKYEQRPFLRSFIDQMTQRRKNAKTKIEEGICKNTSNCNFGKSIQNCRDMLDATIVTDSKLISQMARSPLFHGVKYVSQDMMIVYMVQPVAKMNRPYAVGKGHTILEGAKWNMFNEYYNFLQPNMKNMQLILTDTDSYVFKFTTEDLDQKLSELQLRFNKWDFSNYPKDHVLYDAQWKNILGRWKLETAGLVVITEAIAPKNKIYFLETEAIDYKKKKDSDENHFLDRWKLENPDLVLKSKPISSVIPGTVSKINRLKGIPTKVQETITKEQYKDAVLDNKTLYSNFTKIRAKNHLLETVLIRRMAMTGFDDKRYYLNCGVHSYPYGSVLIQENGDCCKKCT